MLNCSKAGHRDRREVAETSEWESPRKRRLCNTLLTLIAPDSMPTAPAKARTRTLGAEHELPTPAIVRTLQATPARRRGQLCEDGVRSRASKWWRKRIGSTGAVEPESVAELIGIRNC